MPPLRADAEVLQSGFKSALVAFKLSTIRPLAYWKFVIEQVLWKVLIICFDVMARPVQLGSAMESRHSATLCGLDGSVWDLVYPGYVQQFAKTVEMILSCKCCKVHVYSRWAEQQSVLCGE